VCIVCIMIEDERLSRAEAVAAGRELIRTEELDDEELAHLREVIYENSQEYLDSIAQLGEE